MTLLDLIQKTTAFFEKSGVPDARLDVELLLAHVLDLKRMDLYLQFERVLSEAELDRLRPLVRRRATREPLQHLVGTVEFCGLQLAVTPQALIPRPETEGLVEKALHLLDRPAATVLDMGTGTGAIALAIARARPAARCVAIDLSEEALALARVNGEKHGLLSRVDFRPGNLFEPLKPDERFDLIVSNPPYIPSDDIPGLQPEVRFDPVLALNGGADGLEMIRKLAAGAGIFLKEGGWLVMEIGHRQAPAVRELLKATGWQAVEFEKDFQGMDRVAAARKGTG